MPNRYNDQDYPRYTDRNDRYDSQREGGSNRSRGEQRNSFGSGRENTQGGSYDYNQDRETGYYGSEYGRERDSRQNSGDNDDSASSSRLGGGNYSSRRNLRSDEGDYTLYGYDRDRNSGDRSGDYGGYDERTSDYQNQNYGGSSRFYGNQDNEKQGGNRGGNNEQRGGQNFGQRQSFYGQGGDNTGSNNDRDRYSGSSESGFDDKRSENRSRNRQGEDERGWWERTTDEVASWFGNDEAMRRRESDSSNYSQNTHRGRGPKNYRRSDARILEDVNDRLTDYPYLDASDIDVEVANNGEVTLTGMVDSRNAKRMAENIAESVSGVTHIENRLRVKQQNQSQNQNKLAATNTADSSGTFGSREDLAANYSNQNLSENSPVDKSPLGELSGSNETTETTLDSETGTMAATSSGTGAMTTLNTDATSGRDDSITSTDSAFGERGVDKLSKP